MASETSKDPNVKDYMEETGWMAFVNLSPKSPLGEHKGDSRLRGQLPKLH